MEVIRIQQIVLDLSEAYMKATDIYRERGQSDEIPWVPINISIELKSVIRGIGFWTLIFKVEH